MLEWLREHGVRLAAWFPLAMGLLAMLSGVALFALRRRPAGAGRTAAGFALALALGLTLTALLVSLGPMAPLFGSAGRLQASVGRPAPDLAFTRVGDGRPGRLADFRGRVVLVNLWATWCPPCRRELPVLDGVQVALADRGLVVLTLSDEPVEALRDFVAAAAPHVVNGRVDNFGPLAIRDFRPFTLVIDREGRLRDFVFGDQDSATFARKVMPYL